MRRHKLAWWRDHLPAETLGDLRGSLSAVERELRSLQTRGRRGKTLQNYAETLRAFCRWCVERGYLADDPLARLGAFNSTTHEKRRALSPAEIRRLLARCAPARRLVYEVALCSGLRAHELRSLVAGDFKGDLGGLHLRAEWTKNRREGFQPLPDALLAKLVHRIRDTEPGAPLLSVPSHTARELDKDLKAAGIAKFTPEGRFDFHALRVTFVTRLHEAGATVKELQTLARHATANLTMNVYARADRERTVALAQGLGRVIMAGAESTTRA